MVSLGRLPVLALLALSLSAGPASKTVKEAEKAAAKGDYLGAYLLYSEAFSSDTADASLWQRMTAMRARAFNALAGAQKVRNEANSVPAAPGALPQLDPRELREARAMASPARLQAKPHRHSWNARANARQLYENIGKEYGFTVIFDNDYPAGGNALELKLDDADFALALRAVNEMTGSFAAAKTERQVLVAKDTAQKRQEHEPVANVFIPLDEPIAANEIQEIARLVASVFDIQKVGIDSARNAVLLRGRISLIQPALAMYRQILSHRAQMAVEIEVVEVSENAALNLGATLPSRFPVAALAYLDPRGARHFTAGTVAAGAASFGGGLSLFGVVLSGAQLFADLSRAQALSLRREMVTGVDGQAASVHIGDRYPMVTTRYDLGQAAGAYTPPPAMQYEDLGLTLKLTPHIHGTEEVTLELEAEYKALAGKTANAMPIVGNRKFTARPRLRFGEAALVAGLISTSRTRARSGIPGLIALPLLSERQRADERVELMLTLRPALLNAPPEDTYGHSLWVGSEGRPAIPLQ